jgi:hypothetical protein
MNKPTKIFVTLFIILTLLVLSGYGILKYREQNLFLDRIDSFYINADNNIILEKENERKVRFYKEVLSGGSYSRTYIATYETKDENIIAVDFHRFSGLQDSYPFNLFSSYKEGYSYNQYLGYLDCSEFKFSEDGCEKFISLAIREALLNEGKAYSEYFEDQQKVIGGKTLLANNILHSNNEEIILFTNNENEKIIYKVSTSDFTIKENRINSHADLFTFKGKVYSSDSSLYILNHDNLELDEVLQYPEDLIQKNSSSVFPFISKNPLIRINEERLIVWFPLNSIWYVENEPQSWDEFKKLVEVNQDDRIVDFVSQNDKDVVIVNESILFLDDNFNKAKEIDYSDLLTDSTSKNYNVIEKYQGDSNLILLDYFQDQQRILIRINEQSAEIYEN